MEHDFAKMRFCQLRQKDVVNAADGSSLGQPVDLEFDWDCGKLLAIILPQRMTFNPFAKKEELRIPVECVEKIGTDVILVRTCPLPRKDP